MTGQLQHWCSSLEIVEHLPCWLTWAITTLLCLHFWVSLVMQTLAQALLLFVACRTDQRLVDLGLLDLTISVHSALACPERVHDRAVERAV